jgi:hypothetical protein
VGYVDALWEADLDIGELADLTGTFVADLAVFELDGWALGAAEQADVLALVEDDALPIDADLELVAFMDPENTTQLRGEHYAAKLIDLANHPGRLQRLPSWRLLDAYLIFVPRLATVNRTRTTRTLVTLVNRCNSRASISNLQAFPGREATAP